MPAARMKNRGAIAGRRIKYALKRPYPDLFPRPNSPFQTSVDRGGASQSGDHGMAPQKLLAREIIVDERTHRFEHARMVAISQHPCQALFTVPR